MLQKALILTIVLFWSANAFVVGEIKAVDWPFTNCDPSATWNINKLVLSQVPARNVDTNFAATGTASDHIQFESAELVVKLNGLFLHGETVTFDKKFDDGDEIEFDYHQLVPSFAPAGTYTLTFNFKDKQKKDNGCFSFSFKL